MKNGQRVAVIGTSQVRNEGGMSYEEMIFAAPSRALQDAGISRDAIDNVVIAGSDQWDGRAISSMLAACPAGAYFKDEIKVTDGGIYGLAMAWMRIASGVFDTSLVVSWTKPSEVPSRQIEELCFEPIFLRPSGLTARTALALEATRYMATSGATEDDGAKVLSKNRSNGASNPLAERKSPLSASDALKENYLVTPLRQSWLPPDSDGACAMVLTTESNARNSKKTPAFVEGLGWSTFEYHAGDRDFGKLVAAQDAAKRAYKMAGVNDPVRDLDFAEVSDVTPFHELMLYEALGFCPPEKGKDAIRSGLTQRDGKFPVNPSGGLLCFNPPVAGSLIRAVEAASQVRGQAGAHRLANAKRGLAQGSTGPFSQGACVVIFSGE